MRYVKSFREWDVYKLSRELAFKICNLSQSYLHKEKYYLTDIIRRSSKPIDAQIAELWSKHRYEKHFVSKLTDADSEQFEKQQWIEVLLEFGYIEDFEYKLLSEKCELAGIMLQSMISKSNLFC